MAVQADNRSYGGEGVVANSSPTERIHGAFKRKTKFSSSGCLRGHRGESRGLRLNALKDRHTYLCRKAWRQLCRNFLEHGRHRRQYASQ
jgi:hypothetical protein